MTGSVNPFVERNVVWSLGKKHGYSRKVLGLNIWKRTENLVVWREKR